MENIIAEDFEELTSNTIEKFRDRKFMLLLYPDNIIHANALEQLKRSYECCYILHDRDVKKNGEADKPHYHVVVRFPSQRWNTALADELGIEPKFCGQPWDKLDSMLCYLIHRYQPTKVQYKISEVDGLLKPKLEDILAKQLSNESDDIQLIMEFIENYQGVLSMTKLIKWSCSNGVYGTVRRGASLVATILKEHNEGKA